MSGWTAKDFKAIRKRWDQIKDEETKALSTAGSTSPSTPPTGTPRVADYFKPVNATFKKLAKQGTEALKGSATSLRTLDV